MIIKLRNAIKYQIWQPSTNGVVYDAGISMFSDRPGGLLSGFNDIPGISLKKASEVFDGNTHQPVSGF